MGDLGIGTWLKNNESIVKDLKKNLGNLNVNQGFLNAKKYVFVTLEGDFLDVENLNRLILVMKFDKFIKNCVLNLL